MTCKHCGSELEQGVSFCGKCGTPAVSFCIKCGTAIPATPDTKCCPACKTKIVDMAVSNPTISPDSEPEIVSIVKKIRFPEWYPVQSTNPLNWAVAIHPVLCVLFLIFPLLYSWIVFLLRAVATGFSLYGLFKKKSWCFLTAAIIQAVCVLLITATCGFIGLILSVFTAGLAVIGFFAYNQFRQNEDAIFKKTADE